MIGFCVRMVLSRIESSERDDHQANTEQCLIFSRKNYGYKILSPSASIEFDVRIGVENYMLQEFFDGTLSEFGTYQKLLHNKAGRMIIREMSDENIEKGLLKLWFADGNLMQMYDPEAIRFFFYLSAPEYQNLLLQMSHNWQMCVISARIHDESDEKKFDKLMKGADILYEREFSATAYFEFNFTYRYHVGNYRYTEDDDD